MDKGFLTFNGSTNGDARNGLGRDEGRAGVVTGSQYSLTEDCVNGHVVILSAAFIAAVGVL